MSRWAASLVLTSLALSARVMAAEPLDAVARVVVAFDPDSQQFGIAVPGLKNPRDPNKPKFLTADERGQANNTVVRIDGSGQKFGDVKAGNQWARIEGTLYKGFKDGTRKWISAMDFTASKVRVTQTVHIVVGEQTRLYDTVLVTYQIENLDASPHKIGLRSLIDVTIGGNPGQPVFLPPLTRNDQATLVDGKAVLEGKKIPAFVRPMESTDPLDAKVTVAEMGLAIKGLEALDKLVICRRPDDKAGAAWDWPYRAIDDPKDKASTCVVLYWAETELRPGAKRLCGYSYGLGRISELVQSDRK